MSSANYITARDLFLAHHWARYLPFERARFEGFRCGRVAAKDGAAIILNLVEDSRDVGQGAVLVAIWDRSALREPKAAEAAPPVHEVLNVGDWIGVNQAGETVLFAPCSQRGATALQAGGEFADRARAWADFLARVRGFFTARSFVEVTTPTLAPSPGTEPFLDPVSVTIESGGVLAKRFLITSPEFHLKKALSAGLSRVFEIAKCFRDREGGGHHRVEFHMLEWYRSFASLAEIADDVEGLFKAFDAETRLRRTTMAALFREFANFSLEPSTTRTELAVVAASLDVRITADDDFDDIFHRIFLEKIEPRLDGFAHGDPLLIAGYPPSMAALARIGHDGFADRFEVYWMGLELCNAFHELNDPSENRRRFDKDNSIRERSGREAVPIDDELLQSFDLGVPPSGGIALGLERLFMALYKIPDIGDVRPFLRD